VADAAPYVVSVGALVVSAVQMWRTSRSDANKVDLESQRVALETKAAAATERTGAVTELRGLIEDYKSATVDALERANQAVAEARAARAEAEAARAEAAEAREDAAACHAEKELLAERVVALEGAQQVEVDRRVAEIEAARTQRRRAEDG
jgi:hypothetical protein